MARYIDADALIEALQNEYDKEGAKADDMAIKGCADASVKYSHGQFCYLNAMERAKDMPTADVVPKSEVDFLRKTIAENAQKALEVALEEIEKAKAEVAREIWEQIDVTWSERTGVGEFFENLAKLKKKYPEETT